MDLLSDSISVASSRGQQRSLPRTTNTSSGHARPSDEMTDNKPAHLTRLEDLNNELQLKKTELSQLASDYDHVLRTNHTMLKDNRDLAARMSQLENDLSATQQQNNSIKHELQACKDDLFRMQPSTEIPDSVVAKAYDELQVHISSWLEGEISSFETNYRKRHQGVLPNLFDHRHEPEVERIITEYPTTGGEYIVRCLIQILLHREIFADSVLLLGLDEETTTLLQRVEQSMSKAKPPRGTVSGRPVCSALTRFRARIDPKLAIRHPNCACEHQTSSTAASCPWRSTNAYHVRCSSSIFSGHEEDYRKSTRIL